MSVSSFVNTCFVPLPIRTPCECPGRYTSPPVLHFRFLSCYSLCLCLGHGFLELSGSYRFGLGLSCHPRLASAGVQITRRALDSFQRNLSHSDYRTTQTLTPHQRPCGGISSSIRRCHVPSKFILITQTVRQPLCKLGIFFKSTRELR